MSTAELVLSGPCTDPNRPRQRGAAPTASSRPVRFAERRGVYVNQAGTGPWCRDAARSIRRCAHLPQRRFDALRRRNPLQSRRGAVEAALKPEVLARRSAGLDVRAIDAHRRRAEESLALRLLGGLNAAQLDLRLDALGGSSGNSAS